MVHDRAEPSGDKLKKESIGVIVPDPEDFVITFLAAATAGVVTVPLYPPLGFGKLDSYIRDTARVLRIANVRMLITSKTVQPVLWSLMSEVPSMERLACIEKLKGQPRGDVEQIARFSRRRGLYPVHLGKHRGLKVSSSLTTLGACQTIMERYRPNHLDTDATLSWLPSITTWDSSAWPSAPWLRVCMRCGTHHAFIKRPVSWMR